MKHRLTADMRLQPSAFAQIPLIGTSHIHNTLNAIKFPFLKIKKEGEFLPSDMIIKDSISLFRHSIISRLTCLDNRINQSENRAYG